MKKTCVMLASAVISQCTLSTVRQTQCHGNGALCIMRSKLEHIKQNFQYHCNAYREQSLLFLLRMTLRPIPTLKDLSSNNHVRNTRRVCATADTGSSRSPHNISCTTASQKPVCHSHNKHPDNQQSNILLTA